MTGPRQSPASPVHPSVHTLLLVRNGVTHDARVLRAARVAERTLGGRALIVGVATASAPAGSTTVEGIAVTRLPAYPPRLAGLRKESLRRAKRGATAGGASVGGVTVSGAAAGGVTVGDPLSDSATHNLRDPPSTSATHNLRDPPSTSAARNGGTRLRRALAGASFTWQALTLARRVRPQLVHANDWNTMWCAVAIKFVCGGRLVYDSHELWSERNGRWEWRWWLLASELLFMRVANAVVTASPGYADVLARRNRVPRPAIVRNIPEAEQAQHTTCTPQTPPLMVYVGGLMPGRGLEQTIDALALAPGVRLRAVGPGSARYRAELTARACAAGVGDRLELKPPVAPASVTKLLQHATAGLCLIQPVCRSYELTLPNKLFEYAAAGVPVLASDLPVIASVVRGNQLGEVVPATDRQGIAAAMLRLSDPGRWRETAMNAREFARVNNWDAESSELAQVYARALRGSAR